MSVQTTLQSDIPLSHPYADKPYLWERDIQPAPLADPYEPNRLFRSHLNKIEIGKSGVSCRVAFVARLHRSTVLQEFWCASHEEAEVYLNLAAHPDVVNFKEQLTRVPFVDKDGNDTHTLVDAHALLTNGEEVLFSVKYAEKATRRAYLDEVSGIAEQCSSHIADRFVVASRYSFHPVYRECAKTIHKARRGWDPAADRIVLEASQDLDERFRFQELVERSGLSGRGYRAAVRLIADGDIKKAMLDEFSPGTVLWRNEA